MWGGALAFTPNGRLLAMTCDWGICLHDGHSLAFIRRLETGETTYCAAFSPDGTLVAAGTNGGKVWLWDIASGTLETTLEGGRLAFDTVAFSDDGATLIASDLFPTAYAWRVADGAPLRSFRGPKPTPSSFEQPHWPSFAVLSPDGTLLAWATGDVLRLWRTDDGILLRSLRGRGAIYSPAFFAGGRFLVAYAGQQIVLWERQQTELALARTIGHGDSACLALSPDGSLLATGSVHEGTLLLRRVEDGAMLRSFKTQHGEGLGGLLFSPDGSLLVTWGGGVTCLWGLAP